MAKVLIGIILRLSPSALEILPKNISDSFSEVIIFVSDQQKEE